MTVSVAQQFCREIAPNRAGIAIGYIQFDFPRPIG
jgi:hypothetical protein